MNAFGVFVAILSYIGMFIVGILMMIFGWGLQPASWGWIIGGTFATGFLAMVSSFALKYD